MSFFQQFQEANDAYDGIKNSLKNAKQVGPAQDKYFSKFFPVPETITDFLLTETLPKFADIGADDKNTVLWNGHFQRLLKDPNMTKKALFDKMDSSMIPCEQIMIDQLKSKPGGQIVEFTGDGVSLALLELPSEQQVLVYFHAEPKEEKVEEEA